MASLHASGRRRDARRVPTMLKQDNYNEGHNLGMHAEAVAGHKIGDRLVDEKASQQNRIRSPVLTILPF